MPVFEPDPRLDVFGSRIDIFGDLARSGIGEAVGAGLIERARALRERERFEEEKRATGVRERQTSQQIALQERSVTVDEAAQAERERAAEVAERQRQAEFDAQHELAKKQFNAAVSQLQLSTLDMFKDAEGKPLLPDFDEQGRLKPLPSGTSRITDTDRALREYIELGATPEEAVSLILDPLRFTRDKAGIDLESAKVELEIYRLQQKALQQAFERGELPKKDGVSVQAITGMLRLKNQLKNDQALALEELPTMEGASIPSSVSFDTTAGKIKIPGLTARIRDLPHQEIANRLATTNLQRTAFADVKADIVEAYTQALWDMPETQRQVLKPFLGVHGDKAGGGVTSEHLNNTRPAFNEAVARDILDNFTVNRTRTDITRPEKLLYVDHLASFVANARRSAAVESKLDALLVQSMGTNVDFNELSSQIGSLGEEGAGTGSPAGEMDSLGAVVQRVLGSGRLTDAALDDLNRRLDAMSE